MYILLFIMFAFGLYQQDILLAEIFATSVSVSIGMANWNIISQQHYSSSIYVLNALKNSLLELSSIYSMIRSGVSFSLWRKHVIMIPDLCTLSLRYLVCQWMNHWVVPTKSGRTFWNETPCLINKNIFYKQAATELACSNVKELAGITR